MAYRTRINCIADNGKVFESVLADELTRRGYSVQWNRKHKIHAVDVSVGAVDIEVKGARKSKGKRAGYKFCLHRRGKSAPIVEHVVALVCGDDVLDATFFLMPASAVEGVGYITLPLNVAEYAGKYSVWRDAFDVIDAETRRLAERSTT